MLPIKLISLFLINKLSDEISILENLKISKIKLSLIPCHTKKCTLFSCKKLILKNNILNLKNLEEGKTNCKNGALIWRNIYNLSNNNIKQLVSGIHFLISGFPGIPHYYNLIFFKYHNIYVYLKSRKFFKNFMLLFIFIRNRMKSLFVNKQTDQKNIEIIENIIKEIGCLDCEKCQILGSLYFYGLLGSIRNKDLNDKIYTILLYKKILSTFKMVNFLENLIK
ncbi:endoplasmic reticulum membrane-associated oxidoreductin (ERO1) [Vairimorpha necatrix]|uniref:Endoplasmic reticulum membrane-associated oxidoreductin (ERO1) n=1 Tax=Vairimorpha necatrix TaxID=6039 RepID=A0AAX4J8Y3_9MICR